MTRRTRRSFDPTPDTLAQQRAIDEEPLTDDEWVPFARALGLLGLLDPLTDEQFESTERYLMAFTNWAQDDADVRERFAGTDQYATAWDSWQRWMER